MVEVGVDGMMFLHDIWVNWFEGEEHGYNVCHFHEWRKTDKLQLLERVPLLYIKKSLFTEIENHLVELPADLLELIQQETFLRHNNKRLFIQYGCVLTSGDDVLAIDTAGFQIPLRKSRLMPKHEQVVYRMIAGRRPQFFKRKRVEEVERNVLLSPPAKWMYGLTRRERQLKQILLMALDQLKIMNHGAELKYWLTEWRPKDYLAIRYMNEQVVWEILFHEMASTWSKKHEEFGEKLIKNYPFLAKMWHVELNEAEDISSLK